MESRKKILWIAIFLLAVSQMLLMLVVLFGPYKEQKALNSFGESAHRLESVIEKIEQRIQDYKQQIDEKQNEIDDLKRELEELKRKG